MINSPKKPIKVAVVGYKLADGGLERVFGNTTKMLNHAGIEVHTLVLENKIEYEFGGDLVSFGNYSKFLKYFKLRNYLQKQKFPILHSHLPKYLFF
jgi:N-acetylgalactosamine-N,N'-diacetylbacillosaminyl-diphospho-undecaprenol 4-alpha-N-acetylgalactosaminyltransferase